MDRDSLLYKVRFGTWGYKEIKRGGSYQTYSEWAIMEGFKDFYTIYLLHSTELGPSNSNGLIYENNSMFVWDINLESILAVVRGDGDFVRLHSSLFTL